MKSLVIASALVVTCASGLLAQAPQQSKLTMPAVLGKWDVTVVNRADTLVLDLVRDDDRYFKGTYANHPIVGEIRNGQLAFGAPTTFWRWLKSETGTDGADFYETMNFATIKADGTLDGYSGVYIRGYGNQVIKKMSWTGKRK